MDEHARSEPAEKQSGDGQELESAASAIGRLADVRHSGREAITRMAYSALFYYAAFWGYLVFYLIWELWNVPGVGVGPGALFRFIEVNVLELIRAIFDAILTPEMVPALAYLTLVGPAVGFSLQGRIQRQHRLSRRSSMLIAAFFVAIWNCVLGFLFQLLAK